MDIARGRSDKAHERLALLEALAFAFEHRAEFDRLVWQSTDRGDAIGQLAHAPWNMSDHIANWVIDSPLYLRTETARQRLADEASALRRHVTHE